MFFTRGTAFGKEDKDNGKYDALRIYVWARAKQVGSRDPLAVAMAVCELAGQIMVFDQSHFDGIGEEEVAAAQREATALVYDQVKDKVKELLKEKDED